MIEQRSIDTQITSARILYYDFFANLFLYELLVQNHEVLAKQAGFLAQYPLNEGDEEIFARIGEQLASALKDGLENSPIVDEYTRLFMFAFGEGQKMVSLYLSHYKEGCMGGKSLVWVKDMLKESGFFLNKDFSKENEDQLGVLCLFMKHLLQKGEVQKANAVYKDAIAEIKEHVISELESHKAGVFYRQVGEILRSFCLLEDSLCGLI